MDYAFVWQLLIGLLSAAAVYGGIRSDLLHMRERIEVANENADKAHERITHHVEHFHAK